MVAGFTFDVVDGAGGLEYLGDAGSVDETAERGILDLKPRQFPLGERVDADEILVALDIFRSQAGALQKESLQWMFAVLPEAVGQPGEASYESHLFLLR